MKRPGWYAWWALVGTFVLSAGLMMTVVLHVNQRSLDRERRARRDSELTLCTLVVAQSDAYREAPPINPSGKKVQQALDAVRALYRCP